MEGCSPRSGPQRDTIFVPALEVNSEQDHSLPPAERPPETLEPGMGARCPGTALDEFSSPRKVTKPALSGRRRHITGTSGTSVYRRVMTVGKNRGLQVVAFGGGTGLPVLLRGLKDRVGDLRACLVR